MRVFNVKWRMLLVCLYVGVFSGVGYAQTASDTSFKPSGKLWGYTFGDFYYKAHSDVLNRGGANQYTGIEQGRNAFQLRRVYLGYNYEIHPKFSAELLLAAEDNSNVGADAAIGDLTANGKLTFYIKHANLRWKNIWKGTDLVVGQSATPAFSVVEDPTWSYRSIQRTLVDIRRMPSFDLGVALQGKFDAEEGNYGYNLMIGNGAGARPEINKFKHLYGNVYARFFEKKVVLSLFADYERLNWLSGFHHDRNMVKGFAAYTTPAFTVGVEAFTNYSRQDVIGMHVNGADTSRDTLNANATGVSTFVRGAIIQDKLHFFARYDWYNPDTKYNDAYYQEYKALSPNYEPNNKERFITAGLDFMPIRNVHFMPNIWYIRYVSERTNVSGREKQDYDLVYRMTFYYVFGR